MKSIIYLIAGLLLVPRLTFSQDVLDDPGFWQGIKNSHDISLSSWGPYSKKYAGISHIPDLQAGLRFDFSIMPGYYRNKIIIPNVLFESGYFPWKAAPDLRSFTYRYELEWKDRVYVDANFLIVDSATVGVQIQCVNNTAVPQNLDLNLLAFLDYPEEYPIYSINRPQGVTWINAVDYRELIFAKSRPSDNLVYNGWMRGESRDSGFVDGRGIGKNFGKDSGDRVVYDIDINGNRLNGNLCILFRMKENARCTYQATGLVNQKVELAGSGKLEQILVPYKTSGAGIQQLTLESLGGDPVELNGFLFIPDGEKIKPGLIGVKKEFVPEIIKGLSPKNVILKYKDVPQYYGIAWDNEQFRLRELKNDDLDVFLRKTVHNHVKSSFIGNEQGHYFNVFIRPVEIEPHDSTTVYTFLCSGGLEDVKKRLGDLESLKKLFIADESFFASSTILPEGEKYKFSCNMLQATLLTNIVYPVYTQQQYIRHFCPGKWWNSLYTWDLGFIAIGLNEIDRKLAGECINAYTTPVGSQSAFIHHGTPLPVQVYAFFDLWNKTQSRELLKYFYPRLAQYYNFLAGNTPGSTTRTLKSNMIKTWDYFYNSGGWDDYPPQVNVHQQKAEKFVSPVANTAHCIRMAKLLRMAAEELGMREDIKKYEQDISMFAGALQNYSWNESSGYFSYVTHDENGFPQGRYKYEESGLDFNMGLDGVYPLFAGICTPEQEKILLEKIFSDRHLWTPTGISVVDQSAPYYRIDGYWNGAVWMPHQWFMWKTMLDLGRFDLAYKIAHTAMEVYQKETDASYYTFEHFFAKTGRGAGWHQFSGLSSPVLSWFAAYFKKGTATTGFEVHIKKQQFNQDFSSYTAHLSFDQTTKPHSRSILICMNPNYKYQVKFKGKNLTPEMLFPGLLQLTLPSDNAEGVLEVEVKN